MHSSSRPLSILITNDDGIYADGLWALHQALVGSGHQVHVVAPERECSATGHGLTFHSPIKARKVIVNDGREGWAVAGTPADCIKLATAELLTQPPDMVVAGINPGANVGVNLNYSGTVAAAREAALGGFKAISVSVQYSGLSGHSVHGGQPRYEPAASFSAGLVAQVEKQAMTCGTFLNVNVPDRPADLIAGVRLGSQAYAYTEDIFEKRCDPRNQTYYWYGRDLKSDEADSDSDSALLMAGFITITPLRCDMTDYDYLGRMRTWDIENWAGRDCDT